MTGVKDRTVVVTGVTRGIGSALASALVARGSRVAGIARDAGHLQALFERLGAAFLPLICDVGDPEQVRRAVYSIGDKLGPVDVLINNAGVGHFGPVDTLEIKYWEEMLDTNVSGVFLCTREIVPVMKKQGSGHIVNVASVAAFTGRVNMSGYNASKFAVRGFSEALREELTPFGIKVSAVFPAATDTRFSGAPLDPATPAMSPEDVAAAILHVLEAPAGLLVSDLVLRPMPHAT